jgi:hypothetical protein
MNPATEEKLLRGYFKELQNDPVLAAKQILGVDLAPHQRIALNDMWNHKWNLLVWGRGCGKTFMLGVFCSLRAVLRPDEKVVIAGPGFRQAQLVFQEIETFADKSGVFAATIQGKPIHKANEHMVRFKNRSTIIAVPLGTDGAKIRGLRAHTLVVDETAQVLDEIINTVLLPFMATEKNPVAGYMGYERDDSDTTLVYASSAWYRFNHYYDKYRTFLNEIYNNGNAEEYSVTCFNYEDTPEGFINPKVRDLAQKQSTKAQFNMEWRAIFESDTAGFYPASLIEGVGDIYTKVEMKGNPASQYVLGIDPASDVNTFGLVVMKMGDKMEIVHVNSFKNLSIPEMCTKITDYMQSFNVVRVTMDKGGGGRAIADVFQEGRPVWLTNSDKMTFEKLLVIDEDDGTPVTYEEGRRVIQLVKGSSQSVTELNFRTKAAMESGDLSWPRGLAYSYDVSQEDERIFQQIKAMENEFINIEATPTSHGYFSFAAPTGLNKDRYSAALFAVYGAQTFKQEGTKQLILPSGRWVGR